MNILVTAFDPLGGEKINPVLGVVRQLDPAIGVHTIATLEVPTVFHKSKDMIQHELEHHHYDVVLSIGQAGERFNITPERVGINIDYACIADNKESQPIDVAIRPDGAPAYFSNLPIKSMTEVTRKAGVPASLSNTAGTFVRNHVLYQLDHLADKSYPNLLFNFIHVPFIPEQAMDKPNTPSLSLDTITKRVTAAINTISDLPDVKVALGETRQKIR